MKTTSLIRIAAVTALSAVIAFAITGCGGAGTSKGTAAKVNGTEISEQSITDYIQSFRTAQGLDKDDAWGQWMAQYNYTPSDLRQSVIDMFVGQELVKQAAKDNKVEVTDAEVNEQVSKTKANFSTDEAWKKALDSAGTTEDKYRESLRNAMLEQKLMDKVASENITPTDEQILGMCASYASSFNGAKRSSHILFNASDAEKAQQILDQINSGQISFEDAAKQYSTDTGSASKGGDVGWDLLTTFTSPYQTALDGLAAGQISGLVTSDFGIHIIKCTEVYNAPAQVTSLDQVPSELVERIRTMQTSSNQSTAFQNWLADYQSKATIEVAEMPSGLPYYVDMAKYTSSSSSASTSTSTSSGSSTNSQISAQ